MSLQASNLKSLASTHYVPFGKLTMYDYTPFTSSDLTTAATTAVVNDLSPFAGGSLGLPSGKQLIFFTLGIILTIASLSLIIRALIGDVATPENIAKVAQVAAVA